MNAARVAKLLRELADALEEAAPANDTAPEPAPSAPWRRRRPLPLAKPTGKVKPSELDMQRAKILLDRHYGTK
jgi:hypothetical protein